MAHLATFVPSGTLVVVVCTESRLVIPNFTGTFGNTSQVTLLRLLVLGFLLRPYWHCFRRCPRHKCCTSAKSKATTITSII